MTLRLGINIPKIKLYQKLFLRNKKQNMFQMDKHTCW